MLVAIDELQALPAVDYARLVGELRKYGGGFLLATQTLAGLDRLDPTLRPLLLGNCEALLAFRVAAEEAALLAPEFDELVAATDLTNLERGCAYLKASERGQPAPATWLRVHPPLAPDLALAAALRARGRATWGVPAEAAAARWSPAGRGARRWALISLEAQAERRAAAAEAARRAAAAARRPTPAARRQRRRPPGARRRAGAPGRRRPPAAAPRPATTPAAGPAGAARRGQRRRRRPGAGPDAIDWPTPAGDRRRRRR